MTELPKTLEDAIAQARLATQAALDDGYTRLRVELVFPELKPMPVAEQFIPLFEDLGSHLKVLFPDAGAAALACRDWGEKPFIIRGISEQKATLQPEDQLLLLVGPTAVEVNQVEKLCQQAEDRPVVLLNPNLEDVSVVGIGYAARQLRERFLNTIESCYYLRPLQNGAVLRAYPGAWQVWRETDPGEYQLAAEESRRPLGEDLERILTPATPTAEDRQNPSPKSQGRRSPGLLANLQQFLRALSQ